METLFGIIKTHGHTGNERKISLNQVSLTFISYNISKYFINYYNNYQQNRHFEYCFFLTEELLRVKKKIINQGKTLPILNYIVKIDTLYFEFMRQINHIFKNVFFKCQLTKKPLF